jgi:hypothetical protein
MTKLITKVFFVIQNGSKKVPVPRTDASKSNYHI